MKLDRLLARHDLMGRKKARGIILAGRVRVEGETTLHPGREIDRFDAVHLDGHPIRLPDRPLYLLLHKPAGILSATTDALHRTVIDLVDHPASATLHLAGRLDRHSSGLILLTNDGRWSKALMDPARKVPKTYLVHTHRPIHPDAVAAFARGFHFHTENLTTLPAHLEILTPTQARVTLHEGRYHQIKRMFHRLDNQVAALHRESIGPFILPPSLAPGAWLPIDPRHAWDAIRPSPPTHTSLA